MCGDEEMVVYVKDLTGNEFTLLDDSCTLDRENMTHVWLKVPLKSCLTKNSTKGGMITYQNSVLKIIKVQTGDKLIRRDLKVEMPFRCSKRGNIVPL